MLLQERSTDTLVERLPSRKCGDGTQPPLYAPITAREHVELKVNAACAAADDSARVP